MPFMLSFESSPGDLLGIEPGPAPYEGGGTGDSSNPDGGDSLMNPGRGTFFVLADADTISVALPDAVSTGSFSSWRERSGSSSRAASSEWIAKLGFLVFFFLADVERRGSVLPRNRGLLVGVVSGLLAGRMPAEVVI